MEQVEIINVGGRSGVASEATLSKLVDILSKNSTGTAGQGNDKVIKLEKLAREASTKEIKDSGKTLTTTFKTLDKTVGILEKIFTGFSSALSLVSGGLISLASGAIGVVTKAISGFAGIILSGITTSFKILGASVNYVSKLFNISSGKLSDFTDALFGTSNFVTKTFSMFSHWMDQGVASLRDLSSVGATFSGGIFAMREAAAASSLSITDFADMVKSNTKLFAELGGTVTDGAKAFGVFSKNIRTSDTGYRLQALGFTVKDINNGLENYLNIQMMSGKKINLRDESLIKGSKAYLDQLNELSRITGKTKDQIAKQLEAQQRDGVLMAMRSRLNDRQQKNFDGVMTRINTELPGIAPSLKSIMAGVPDDLGKAIMNQVPGLANLMNQVKTGNVGNVEFQRRLKLLQPEIEKFRKSFTGSQLQAMQGMGGVAVGIAAFSNQIGDLTAFMSQNLEKLKAQQAQNEKLTALYASFSQSYQDFKSKILNAFLESPFFSKMQEFLNGLSDTNGLLKEGGPLDSSIKWISDNLFGEKGILTTAFDATSKVLGQFTTDIKNVGFTKAFENLFYGTDKEVADGRIKHQAGLYDSIKNGFTDIFNRLATGWNNFWEGPTGSKIEKTMSDFFNKVLVRIMNSISDYFTGGGKNTTHSVETGSNVTSNVAQSAGNAVSRFIGTGNLFGARIDKQTFLDQAKRSGSWDLRSLSGLDTGYFGSGGYLRSIYSQLQNSGQYKNSTEAKAALENSVIKYIKDHYSQADQEIMMKYFDSVLKKQIVGLPKFAQGTKGFKNFGTESPALLHGNEAVVPRNSPEGAMLNDFYNNEYSKINPRGSLSKQEINNFEKLFGDLTNTIANLSNNSIQTPGITQSITADKLDQLNNTMMHVARLLERELQVQENTLKGIKGMGTDYYRGVPV